MNPSVLEDARRILRAGGNAPEGLHNLTEHLIDAAYAEGVFALAGWEKERVQAKEMAEELKARIADEAATGSQG